MGNEEILHKAIEKVVKEGYSYKHDDWEVVDEYDTYEHIIFSHSFAKAFAKYLMKEKRELLVSEFGIVIMEFDMNDKHCHSEYIKDKLLIKMVIEEEPLKYIERFL